MFPYAHYESPKLGDGRWTSWQVGKYVYVIIFLGMCCASLSLALHKLPFSQFGIMAGLLAFGGYHKYRKEPIKHPKLESHGRFIPIVQEDEILHSFK